MLVSVSAGLPLCDTRRLISSRVQRSDPSCVDTDSPTAKPSLLQRSRTHGTRDARLGVALRGARTLPHLRRVIVELRPVSRRSHRQECRNAEAMEQACRFGIPLTPSHHHPITLSLFFHFPISPFPHLPISPFPLPTSPARLRRPACPAADARRRRDPAARPFRGRMIPFFASSSSALSSARSPLSTVASM